MYNEKSIAVVVPAYNEELLIEKTLKSMPDAVDRIIVVDDASTDRTSIVVEESARVDKRVFLLRHDVNRGVGGAIVSGYKNALEADIDITVVMAGDAQMDPDDFLSIIGPIEEGRADYTKGNRLFYGDAWRMIPHYRYLGNSFLSLLTKIASGYWHIADSQCGYTAISLVALKRIDLEGIYERYGMPNDLLIKLNQHDFRVCDVHVRPVYNIGEKSGIKLRKVVPRISWILLKGFIKRLVFKYVIRDFHPLVFFYLLGIILFPAGLISGSWLIYYRIFQGPVAATSALFAVFLFVSGLQSLFFAMWFDMDYNKDLKVK
ncbi:MAG TPA: glycosyltransferase family 2 protein [Desulfobacteraceae bacterium]|nr:glycosyltransferase family 2 protein [Desulfobacteraceae bacterium]HPJ67546.1 glycosyltransferase family 2 protein [Desulfobacteraceae bacterium]HPQ28489.1 glycosyltransferase family 2 protein [Desulfobacteraceae bacterium]